MRWRSPRISARARWTLGLRPSALRIGNDGIGAVVDLVEHLGDSTIVNLRVDDILVKMRAGPRPPVREGERVRLAFNPDDAHLFDAADQRRL